MILTVTPNAAVDKTYRIEGFCLDAVNRPSLTYTLAGGKGINVARVYRALGGEAVATGFLGGAQGRIVAYALKDEGIPGSFVRVAGETRLCMAAIDPLTGTQTEINESGPEVSAAEILKLFDRVKRLMSQERFSFVVLSGSLPPGVPSSFYAELIVMARVHKTPAVLDASGEALREGLAAHPWMAKPNLTELESILGRKLDNRANALEAARELQRSGIDCVALTMGRDGAILATKQESLLAIPPKIEFASAVASGDSFLAAFLWQWQHGVPPANPFASLRMATGAGAANAAVIGAGFCTGEAIHDLAERTDIRPLD